MARVIYICVQCSQVEVSACVNNMQPNYAKRRAYYAMMRKSHAMVHSNQSRPAGACGFETVQSNRPARTQN